MWKIGDKSFNVQRITIGSHLGTHVDAPLHFVPGGHTIDTYELRDLGGAGVVLPDRHRAERGHHAEAP